MPILDIPNDVFNELFEYLYRAELLACVFVCNRFFELIEERPDLRKRMDLSKAVAIFNSRAVYGVEFVTTRTNMIETSPQALGKWMFATQGLSKKQVAEYLGEKENKEVLQVYMSHYDFSGKHLEDCLRKCLGAVCVPSTTGQLKRILKGFGKRFVTCNPQHFKESEYPEETAYLLCYCMLLLNTDRQSKKVSRKMTKEQFIAYVCSSLNFEITVRYVESLYERISKNPIRMGADTATENPHVHTSVTSRKTTSLWAVFERFL